MKKGIIPVLIAAVALAGCAGLQGQTSETVEEKVVPVEATLTSSGTIERKLIYTGQVKPSEQVYVVPKIGGKVVAVNFDVGDSVKKDDVLFEIDDTDISSSIDSAQAQLNAAQAGVATQRASLESISGAQSENTVLSLETAVKNAEIGLQNASLALEDAKTALDNITVTYNNAVTLYAAGAMSKTQYDATELQYNQALSGYDKALNGKATAETGLAQAKEAYELYMNKTYGTTVRQAQSGVNQAAASAESARVALANAERSLEDLKVKSPLSGVVSAKNVTVGGMAGQTSAAYTVINVDTVKISVNVSEELINLISPGMSVPVYINSVRSEPFNGVISTISPAAEDIKNTYPVEITVSNGDGLLKPGMFTEVHFIKEKSENTVVVPRNTVMEEETSRYVFIAENGSAKKCFIETGIDNGKEIEILSGLPQDALIITKGQTHVTDGDKINIVN